MAHALALQPRHSAATLHQVTRDETRCCLTLEGSPGLQHMLADALCKPADSAPRQAHLALSSQHMGSALAEVAPKAPEPGPGQQQPCQLALQLDTLASTQNAAAFSLLVLEQGQLSQRSVAWCSQGPASASLSWCAVHGGLSLRTAALKAFAACVRTCEGSGWRALSGVTRFLQAHLGCRVDPGQEDAAAWWAAWAACLEAAQGRAQPCSTPGGMQTMERLMAARAVLHLLLQASTEGLLAGDLLQLVKGVLQAGSACLLEHGFRSQCNGGHSVLGIWSAFP